MDLKKTCYVSPGYESFWGKNRKELIVNPLAWLDSVDVNSRSELEKILGVSLLTGEAVKLPDFKINLPDGSYKWISANIITMAYGRRFLKRLIISAHDITESKLAEERFRKSEENYLNIVNNIQDVFYRTDINGNLVMLSPGVKDLLGYESPEECIGLNLATDIYYRSSDRQYLLDLLNDKGYVNDYETVLRRKDGSSVYVSANSHFYYNADGSVAGVEGLVRDISERKKVEEMFNLAFHRNPCPMSITSVKTGFLVEVNKTWLDAMEYERDEVIGKTAGEVNLYRNSSDRELIVDTLLKKGSVSGFEVDFVTKSGAVKNGILSGEVILAGERKMLLSTIIDVTRQRDAERGLRESEERFRRLAENAPDLIYRMRIPDGIYEYVNPVVETITGYSPEELYTIPGILAGLIHPDYREYFKVQWENLLNGIIPPTYEYKIITRDGLEKWLFQRNVLICDDDGRPLAIEGVVSDITERKRFENELRLKSAILASEQEVSLDGILIVDQNGRILVSNNKFSEIWDIPENVISSRDDEMVIKYALRQLPDPETFIAKVRYLYEKIEEKSYDELLFKDGRIIERYSSPVTGVDGEHMGRVWYFRDITARKKAEEAVINEQMFSRSLIDSLPGIFYLYSYPELRLVRWNRNHEKLLGYDNGEIAGKEIFEWHLPENRELVSRAIDVVMDFGINTFEAPMIAKNGDYIPFLLTGASVAVDGRRYLMGVGMDITESRKKDEQLRQAQKLETVGTLAGGLAHDFNNILSGISSTVSLIKHIMDHDEKINERFTKYIDLIDRSGKRAVDLVQQLLTLSRRYEVTKKPVDLKKAVSEVVQICDNTFDKSIKITVEYPDENIVISGDLSQVEQVILNLCVNASHAMTIMRGAGEKQGGMLSITFKHILADSYFCFAHPDASPGWYWLISLYDSGVGIDKAVISNIFDPFFSTKIREQGTGLGLTMVYNIVHQHGGFITVYSEKGNGSVFNVYFPEIKSQGSAVDVPDEISVVYGDGRILVIDDEEIVRIMAENILRECGYSVIAAESGNEGIEIFRREYDSIDAVLLDMAMPGMSGRDVYSELKNIRPDVRVLLASGFRLDERVDEALALGVNGFIQKPYSISDLSRKIKEVMN